MSESEMENGKKHVDRVLAKFLATKTVKDTWFGDLTVEQAKRNLGEVP